MLSEQHLFKRPAQLRALSGGNSDSKRTTKSTIRLPPDSAEEMQYFSVKNQNTLKWKLTQGGGREVGVAELGAVLVQNIFDFRNAFRIFLLSTRGVDRAARHGR